MIEEQTRENEINTNLFVTDLNLLFSTPFHMKPQIKTFFLNNFFYQAVKDMRLAKAVADN